MKLAKEHFWVGGSHCDHNTEDCDVVEPTGIDSQRDVAAVDGSRGLLLSDGWRYGVEISYDDKAYVRPGTGTGMTSTASQKVSHTTEASGIQPRQLPMHAFYEPKFCQTPAAQRYMTRTVAVRDGTPELILDDDDTVFTIRPKAYVGSSGSAWASDHMRVHSKLPHLLEIPGTGDANMPTALKQMCACVHDSTFYFVDTTTEADVTCVTRRSECEFREYELKRIRALEEMVEDALDTWERTEKDDFSEYVSAVVPLTESWTKVREMTNNIKDILVARNVTKNDLWEAYGELVDRCESVLACVQELNPPSIKPRVVELTDAVPYCRASTYSQSGLGS